MTKSLSQILICCWIILTPTNLHNYKHQFESKLVPVLLSCGQPNIYFKENKIFTPKSRPHLTTNHKLHWLKTNCYFFLLKQKLFLHSFAIKIFTNIHSINFRNSVSSNLNTQEQSVISSCATHLEWYQFYMWWWCGMLTRQCSYMVCFCRITI